MNLRRLLGATGVEGRRHSLRGPLLARIHAGSLLRCSSLPPSMAPLLVKVPLREHRRPSTPRFESWRFVVARRFVVADCKAQAAQNAKVLWPNHKLNGFERRGAELGRVLCVRRGVWRRSAQTRCLRAAGTKRWFSTMENPASPSDTEHAHRLRPGSIHCAARASNRADEGLKERAWNRAARWISGGRLTSMCCSTT